MAAEDPDDPSSLPSTSFPALSSSPTAAQAVATAPDAESTPEPPHRCLSPSLPFLFSPLISFFFLSHSLLSLLPLPLPCLYLTPPKPHLRPPNCSPEPSPIVVPPSSSPFYPQFDPETLLHSSLFLSPSPAISPIPPPQPPSAQFPSPTDPPRSPLPPYTLSSLSPPSEPSSPPSTAHSLTGLPLPAFPISPSNSLPLEPGLV